MGANKGANKIHNKVPIIKYIKAENKFKIYSNHVVVTSTAFDISLLVGEMESGIDDIITVNVYGSVVMSPLHAKIHCANLADHIAKYESMFGEIKTPPMIGTYPIKE